MSLRTSGLGAQRGPMSMKDIIFEAETMLNEYTHQIPLRFWLRSADAIQKQARFYECDGNEEEAYKFYYRHAVLVLDKLPGHPDLAIADCQAAFNKAKSDVSINIIKLEKLKPKLQKRHELWRHKAESGWQDRQPTPATKPSPQLGSEQEIIKRMSQVMADMRPQPNAQPNNRAAKHHTTPRLDPSQSLRLAVKLALREKRDSRETAPTSSSQPVKHKGSLSSSSGDSGALLDESQSDDDDLSKNMIALDQRRKASGLNLIERRRALSSCSQPSPSRFVRAVGAPEYPSIPKVVHTDYFSQPDIQTRIQTTTSSDLLSYPTPPSRPPKSYFEDPLVQPPVIPPKLQPSPPASDLLEIRDARKSSPCPSPGIDKLDVRDYSFKSSACTESGAPLRTLFINPKLRLRFLTIALSNTQDNLETCGILCGYLTSNAFFITKLVIPEQENTSDTCDTINEGALFDYCDRENLMTLGWIHTHPTQTCFMSSRDLHTHGGYQVQLAESIAIVCAPRHEPSWGIFRLTDPPGLQAILNCKQTTIFHPHTEKNIYTDALMPGHVKHLENLPFDVVDLRPDKSWL